VDSRHFRIDYRWATDDPGRLRGKGPRWWGRCARSDLIANSSPVLSQLRKQSTTLPMVCR
jgi:hypothetical protein